MTSRRPAPLRIAGIALVAIAASVALVACGGDDSDSDTTASSSGAGTAAGASTISVQSVGGLNALVDAKGKVLYTTDQDTASKIACTGECAGIWVPVTAQSGQPSSDDASVEAKLGVVTNPDGDSQVTFDGKPLYTFVQDSPGEVTGNGVTDSFGGVTFTWTAATAGGSQQGAGATTTTDTETTGSGDSGGGSGGYGY
ncbi:MAG: COG4315 family predicted lipoprotein [Solirubrobacterales bacterium]